MSEWLPSRNTAEFSLTEGNTFVNVCRHFSVMWG